MTLRKFFNYLLISWTIFFPICYSFTFNLSEIPDIIIDRNVENISKLNLQNFIFFQEEDLTKIFSDIENGFNNGTVSSFYSHFSSQNYLSFFNGINGYFSANQSFYVLENFFRIYRPISFNFNNINTGRNPYGTGILFYEVKGKRSSAYIFISLNQTGKSWQISQITIK